MPAADLPQAARGRRMSSGILLGLVLSVGCGSQTPPPPAPAKAQPAPLQRDFPEGSARVEIGAAKTTWLTPEILQFDIPYRFTAGGPRAVYTCSIDFPDTTARGAKPLSAGELDLEGVITTKIAVGEAEVKRFKIELFEAASEDSPYKSISNSAPGDVQARPDEYPTNSAKKAGK
jgi:hypothetical protein